MNGYATKAVDAERRVRYYEPVAGLAMLPLARSPPPPHSHSTPGIEHFTDHSHMDEDKFVYARLYASIYARIAITINSVLTISAFALLFSGDVSVHWTSFSKKFHQDVVVKLNYSNPLKLSDVRGFFEEDHSGHELFINESPHLKIEYGATWNNWCLNDPPLKEGLPSVLRLLEFHSISQALLRFTFLTSLSLRPILTYARSLAVITRLTKASDKDITFPLTPRFLHPPSLPISSLLYASPLLQFLSTLSGSLVLMWHQDLDFHGILWLPYYTFALFYLLHMAVYTSVELLEPRRMNTARAVTRSLLIICFCWTLSPTMERHMEFLSRKTCHPNVATADALCEYVLLLVICLFSLLEWTDVWHLNVTVVENPEEMAIINGEMKIEENDEDERF